jgi:hypothetical protein
MSHQSTTPIYINQIRRSLNLTVCSDMVYLADEGHQNCQCVRANVKQSQGDILWNWVHTFYRIDNCGGNYGQQSEAQYG